MAKLRGRTLSELLQLRDSPEKPADLPTAPGVVTSSCTGSGFSLRTSPLDDVGGAELDLETAGGGGLEGRAKAKGRRLRRVAGGEEEVDRGDRGGPGEDGGGVLRGFRGRAQGRPLLVMISLRVSIGEPLTDHSVMPIWRRWERAWLERPLRFSKYSPQNSQPISFGGSLCGRAMSSPLLRRKTRMEEDLRRLAGGPSNDEAEEEVALDVDPLPAVVTL